MCAVRALCMLAICVKLCTMYYKYSLVSHSCLFFFSLYFIVLCRCAFVVAAAAAAADYYYLLLFFSSLIVHSIQKYNGVLLSIDKGHR